MTGTNLSRRSLIGAGLGIGLTTGVGAGGDAVAATLSRRPGQFDAVSMAMHTHSCFSEGGSYAAGGGGASMMAQLDQAQAAGVDVVWWTDHDWRMQAYGYYDGIAFDGTAEGGGLEWIVQNEGSVTASAHDFVNEPHSPSEPGKAMRVSAVGPAAGWGTSYLFGKGGNSFYSTNISDTTLSLDVLAESVGPDVGLVAAVETSYRPATSGRPAGVYILEYRVGSDPGRRLDGPLTGVVEVQVEVGWQTLEMDLLNDVKAFWPDLVAEDSGLARLRFGARARNGASSSAVFDHLVITRTRDQRIWPVRTQRDLMRRLGKRYPNITQVLGAEVSMIRHLNVFMEDFELYTYPPTGKAPTLDNSVEAAERVINWYHDRGALVQYNHPPTSRVELVETRALGADLIEVADAVGDNTVTMDRMELYDVAARNAIFLTATSQIDDHEGRDWVGKSHLYLTSLWSSSKSTRDLLAALASGRAWCNHQGLWPAGRLDLRYRGRSAMGQVLRTSSPGARVDVVVQRLPAGSVVQVILGACDRTGATESSLQRHEYPAAVFAHKPVSVDVASGHYLRVETYDSDGVLLGFSNPCWVLPTGADVAVPGQRRFHDHV
jgi:hypothetical protein